MVEGASPNFCGIFFLLQLLVAVVDTLCYHLMRAHEICDSTQSYP